MNRQSGDGKKNHSGQRKAGDRVYRRSQMAAFDASFISVISVVFEPKCEFCVCVVWKRNSASSTKRALEEGRLFWQRNQLRKGEHSFSRLK